MRISRLLGEKKADTRMASAKGRRDARKRRELPYWATGATSPSLRARRIRAATVSVGLAPWPAQ